MDSNEKEQVDIWLALALRDGEPWEHTAKICETICHVVFHAVVLSMKGEHSQKSAEILANSTAWDFMPRYFRGPKPKPAPEDEEETTGDDSTGEDSTTKWMKHKAGISNG